MSRFLAVTKGLANRHVELLALAFVLFISSWSELERSFVLVAVALLVWIYLRSLSRTIQPVKAVPLVVVAVALLLYDIVAPRILHDLEGLYPATAYARVVDTAWILLALLLLLRLRRGLSSVGMWRRSIVVLAAIAGAALIIVAPDPAIDVWRLHQQAGETLVQGANPYSDLSIVSTFPADADSNIYTGYPYTPPNLLVFGGSAAITGESRWLSLVCWLGFLALFASLRPRSPTGTALLLLLASQPGWQIVLEVAYTESLTLLLLAGAVVAWKHRRTLGPVFLGVGLATKQYLAVLVPMVATVRMLPVRARAMALGTAVLAAAIGLLWGPTDFVDAAVAFHTRVPPQPNSVNLHGISVLLGSPIVVPAWVGLVVSIGLGLLSTRSARTPSQLLVGGATALGVGFFLASQAFVNYWFLVGGILGMTLLLAEPSSSSDAETDVRTQPEVNRV